MKVKVPSGTRNMSVWYGVEMTDAREIAILLEDTYPKDNVNLRFTDLHKWIISLEDFDDDPNSSNEKILESIQMAWIDERLMQLSFDNIIKTNNLPEPGTKIVVAMLEVLIHQLQLLY